jgi:hypothetical protein
MQPEWITMTAREQRRVQVLAQVLAGELKLWEAAVVLGLSIRQTRRAASACPSVAVTATVRLARSFASSG